MVAVDNSPARRAEYSGRHHAPGGPATNTAFENYEAFLITELKPQIDREYRTLPGAAHTAVMGYWIGWPLQPGAGVGSPGNFWRRGQPVQALSWLSRRIF